jgi:hypothetical protein
MSSIKHNDQLQELKHLVIEVVVVMLLLVGLQI